MNLAHGGWNMPANKPQHMVHTNNTPTKHVQASSSSTCCRVQPSSAHATNSRAQRPTPAAAASHMRGMEERTLNCCAAAAAAIIPAAMASS